MIFKDFAKKFLFFSAAVLVSFSIFNAMAPALPATHGGSTVYAQDEEEEEEPPSCERDADGQEFTWLLCPTLELIDGIVTWMDNAINSLLTVPETYFTDDLYQTWGRMRNIAYILLVPITLVMVISTAMGFDFISAYTIKRALPRLIAAVMFIALSYMLCTFAIQAINVIGSGTLGLLTSSVGGPDQSLDDLFNPNLAEGSGWTFGLLFGGAAAASAAIATGSIGVVLSLAMVAAIGLFLGLIALVGRQLLLVALVLISPLAILAWIFPGNDRLWKLWWSTFSKMLLLYPLIMLLLGSGRALAFVVNDSGATGPIQTLIKFIAYVGPFFFIPATFKLAGSLFATLTSVGRDKARGVFDSQRKYRAERRQQTAQDTLEGTNRRGQMGLVGGIYRRRKMGGFSPTQAGRDRYQSRVQEMRDQVAKKRQEKDQLRAGGDDVAMRLAQTVGDRDTYLNEYATAMRAQGMSEEDAAAAARSSLATVETSFGAKLGTDTLRVAAYKARTASVTGYDGSEQGLAEMVEDASRMVSEGLMTPADATAAIKANKARPDQSGISWGTLQSQVTRSARAYGEGTRGQALLGMAQGDPQGRTEAQVLRDSAINGSEPGALVFNRPETMAALSPRIGERLEHTMTHGTDEQQQEELANVAAMWQNAGATSRDKGHTWMEHVMSRQVGPNGETARQMVEARGGDEVFQQRVRFFERQQQQQGLLAQQQQLLQQQQQQGGAPGGPGGPGPPAPGGPSDSRLKRNIQPLGKQINGTTIQLYRFQYLWSDQEYVGVIAQEVLHERPEAVYLDGSGFYGVDYSVLGTQMYTIEEWQAIEATTHSY